MPVEELRHNILPKREGDSTIILPPSVNILVGITPQQIAEKSRVGHVGGSDDALDLIQARKLRTQPPMGAEYLLVDDRRAREAIEAIRKCFPQLDPEAALALVVESVNAVDRRALVITAQHEEILGVFNLVSEEEADGLQTLLATIDVVAQENVVGLRGEATVFEETEEVIVLSVDVAADLDGGLELEEHGLGDEEVAGAEAEHFDFGFREVYLLPRSGAADAEEFVDNHIDGIAEEGDAASGGLAGRGGRVFGRGSSSCVSV
mmetsp:Transcript_23177/g.37615  ORF Transcript_23177/g.37615 Transcript_23177/m.37615 type:complete len:263 (+) Transcript_23177:584-1372(+)